MPTSYPFAVDEQAWEWRLSAHRQHKREDWRDEIIARHMGFGPVFVKKYNVPHNPELAFWFTPKQIYAPYSLSDNVKHTPDYRHHIEIMMPIAFEMGIFAHKHNTKFAAFRALDCNYSDKDTLRAKLLNEGNTAAEALAIAVSDILFEKYHGGVLSE